MAGETANTTVEENEGVPLPLPSKKEVIVPKKGTQETVRTKPSTTEELNTKTKTTETVGDRCRAITTKIDGYLNRYKNNYDKHRKVYANLKERLQKMVTKLEAKGYDVTVLKTDLVTLDAKLKKLHDDYVAYAGELGETKQFKCGTSEGQFAGSVSEAREKLKIVHQDIVDIRAFYKSVIKSDLQKLKLQARVKTPPPPPPANSEDNDSTEGSED